MRIALVEEGPPARGRGATMSALLARPVGELAEELAAFGHVVAHVRMTHPSVRPLEDLGLDHRPTTVTSPPPVRRLDVASGRELSVLRAFEPDTVFAVGVGPGRVLDHLMPALRVPWVWSPGAERSVDDAGLPWWVPATAARVVVSSNAERDAFAQVGLPRSRCDVVPWRLASRPSVSRPVTDQPRVVRTLLTTTGADGDGVADVVRVLAVHHGLRLVVAVDPARRRRTDPLHPWLPLARGLGVADRVRLVRVTSPEDVWTLMVRAGVLVSVPRSEVQAGLVAAAMWCGVPVVASDLDDVRELIETGSNGLVLPAGDGRRLARTLAVVCRDASCRVQWARAARRRSHELLSPTVTAQAVVEALVTAGLRAQGGRRVVTGRLTRAGLGAAAAG